MNKREKGLLAPTDVKTTIAQLNKLPLRIMQELTQSRSRDKQQLTSDAGFVLDALEIELFESGIDPQVVNVMYMGRIIGRIITRRGHQFYVTMNNGNHNTSKEWKHFLRLMVDRKEEVIAWDVQDEYEDSTDQSLSPDERDFIREFGELADNILSQIGRTDTLRLVKDDRGNYRVCDDERDGEDILWTHSDSRLWGTSIYGWGQLTVFPLQHLTDYVNKLGQSSND